MKAGILALGLTAVLTVPAFAEDTNSAMFGCYDIAMRSGAVNWPPPDGAIMINHCTGQTWMLERISIDQKGSTTFRWRPIGTETAEPFFPPMQMPKLPPIDLYPPSVK